MQVKAIVPGTEGMTHPDSRRPEAVPPLCPRRTASNSRWDLSHCVAG